MLKSAKMLTENLRVKIPPRSGSTDFRYGGKSRPKGEHLIFGRVNVAIATLCLEGRQGAMSYTPKKALAMGHIFIFTQIRSLGNIPILVHIFQLGGSTTNQPKVSKSCFTRSRYDSHRTVSQVLCSSRGLSEVGCYEVGKNHRRARSCRLKRSGWGIISGMAWSCGCWCWFF